MIRNPLFSTTALTAAMALALSPIVATSAAAQQRTEVGNAASVVGKVTMKPDGAGEGVRVARKQRFAWGDLISTAKKSQLQILLLDRSTYGVGARTQLRIDRFVYDPNEGRSSIITFIKGALRFFSGRNDGDNSGEVNTPAGRIGIRGTAVDMLVGERAEKIAEKEEFVGKVPSNEDEATFVVLRGPGAQTLGGLTPGLVEVEGGGVTVTLDEPGLAAYIPRAGAAPIGPFRISNRGLERVQNRMAPEVARANSGSVLDTLLPAALGAVALGVLITELDGDGDDGNNSTTVNPNNNTTIDPYDPNGNSRN
jgi:hypothetical protein